MNKNYKSKVKKINRDHEYIRRNINICYKKRYNRNKSNSTKKREKLIYFYL